MNCVANVTWFHGDDDLDYLDNNFATVINHNRICSIEMYNHLPVVILGHFLMCGLYFCPRVHLKKRSAVSQRGLSRGCLPYEYRTERVRCHLVL